MPRNLFKLFLFLIIFSTISKITAGDFSQVVTVSHFKNNLYLISCVGGEEYGQPINAVTSIASVGEDGILLIDAGFSSTGESLKKELEKLGNGKINKIINTHHHWDHTKGNQFFKDENIKIIGHHTLINRLSGYYYNLPGEPDACQPTESMDGELEFVFNGEKIIVFTVYNCHTEADLYVYFSDNNVLAVGDLLFSDGFPFIAQSSGGTVEGFHKQIRKFITDFPPDTYLVPAHGRIYTRNDLIEYDKMLSATRRQVQISHNEGLSLDEMNKQDILKYWAIKWSGASSFTQKENWIKTIYNDILTESNEAKISICEPLTTVLAQGSADEAILKYDMLKKDNREVYDFNEDHLNMLAYQLVYRNRKADAAKIFELNIREFPQSYNVYDSYGEFLLSIADTTNSIINYEKSFELNPNNTNARNILLRLKKL